MSDTLTATQVGKKIKLVWTYAPAPSWPDANGYIYNEGEHEDMWVEGYVVFEGAQQWSKESDHLYQYVEFMFSGALTTVDKVDLTDHDYVKVEVDVSIGGWLEHQGYYGLLVRSDHRDDRDATYYDARVLRGTSTGGKITLSLDVSSLLGEFYVQIWCIDVYGDGYVRAKTYRVWLE